MKNKAFTILEFIIVLILISTLASLLIYLIKPTEIFKKSRDTKRISDLNTLDYVIGALVYENPSVYIGATNTVYLSLPMDIATTNCKAQYQELPDLPSGWYYYCVERSKLKNIDGTGWIPINFTSYKVLNIKNLPIDPINKPPYFYTYVAGGSYELTAVLEMLDSSYKVTSEDGGDNDYIYEAGDDKTLTPLAIQIRGLMPGFAYKREVYLTSAVSLTDYQTLITLDTQSLISEGKMKNDCSDLRITDSNGKTLLNFWLEPQTCNTGNTRIWVKIPEIKENSTKTIIAYYGKNDAESISNGANVFLLFNLKENTPFGYSKNTSNHSNCLLLYNGNLKCLGWNGYAQLGYGAIGYKVSPQYVLENVSSTSAFNHTCALKNDGTVYCWGYNYYGQLGNGTTNNTLTPTQVLNLSNATQISAGGLHTCALKNDGTVYCWGRNYYGQLGNGTTNNTSTPTQVLNLSNVVQISAGYEHTCALKNDGTVYCWGRNNYGQLGNGTTNNTSTPVQVSTTTGLTNAIQISSDYYHTCALKNDGTVYCWGYNNYGQLGNGTTNNTSTPTQVLNLSNIVQISSGYLHTCALKNDGTVYCWGYNYYGQLGNGTTNNTSTPVQVSTTTGLTNAIKISSGGNHTCALKNDNTAYCWGYNVYGQLGRSETASDRWSSSVTKPALTTFSDAKEIILGYSHTCGIKNDNKLYCWGDNYYGQLGIGSNDVYQLNLLLIAENIKGLALGFGHSCFIDKNGYLKCWGRNDNGQVGDGTTLDKLSPVDVQLNNIIQISTGYSHTCALKNDNTAYCWGYNAYGQLGDGTTVSKTSPVKVNINNVVQISAGNLYTCALKNDGTVYCWGYNAYGQLGNGTTNNTSTPTQVLNLSNIVQISLGYLHTCALKNDGTVYCWGYNNYGQLGNGTTNNTSTPTQVLNLSNVVQISSGYLHTCALKNDGTVYCWGHNYYGQLGNGTTNNTSTPTQVLNLSNIVQISSGCYHTCALKNDGTVYCWGYNYYGQLGNGTTNNTSTPTLASQLGNIGGRFDKSNGIYSIPDPNNDVYFIRKYSATEPNFIIGEEQRNI